MTGKKASKVLLARFVLGVATPDENDRVVELLDGDDASSVLKCLPDPQQAAWTLLEVHIGALAHGKMEPELGLGILIDEVFRSPELIPSRGRSMGASHDATRLVALQDQYDDIMRRERSTGSRGRYTSEVDAQVVYEAREWMRRNSTGRVGNS